MTAPQIAMLEKSPHKNGARLFINWMLSREAQVVQHATTFAAPVHKDLQTPNFLLFADTIIGKPHLVRDDAMLIGETNNKMHKLWDSLWVTVGEKGAATSGASSGEKDEP